MGALDCQVTFLQDAATYNRFSIIKSHVSLIIVQLFIFSHGHGTNTTPTKFLLLRGYNYTIHLSLKFLLRNPEEIVSHSHFSPKWSYEIPGNPHFVTVTRESSGLFPENPPGITGYKNQDIRKSRYESKATWATWLHHRRARVATASSTSRHGFPRYVKEKDGTGLISSEIIRLLVVWNMFFLPILRTHIFQRG